MPCEELKSVHNVSVPRILIGQPNSRESARTLTTDLFLVHATKYRNCSAGVLDMQRVGARARVSDATWDPVIDKKHDALGDITTQTV